ncbi:Os04g0315350, partial [Oryza sativa Japonica Group]
GIGMEIGNEARRGERPDTGVHGGAEEAGGAAMCRRVEREGCTSDAVRWVTGHQP